jgi:hypothetical protein
MTKVVIYPLSALSEEPGYAKIAVMYPAPQSRLTVEQIAMKDVPPGTPYLIIDAAELPEDSTYRGAWDADFSQPTGIGLGPEEFWNRNPSLLAAISPAAPSISPVTPPENPE